MGGWEEGRGIMTCDGMGWDVSCGMWFVVCGMYVGSMYVGEGNSY